MTVKSRNAVVGAYIEITKGVHLYKVAASPFFRVKVWIPAQKKYVVRSTRKDNQIEARAVAIEYARSVALGGEFNHVPASRTFRHFADELVRDEQQRGQVGQLHVRLWKNTRFYLEHRTWGLLKRFADRDIEKIEAKDYHLYQQWVVQQNRELKPATMNHIASTFSKVMKTALREGAVQNVPAINRVRRKDNPRPFFEFSPRVSREHDEVSLLRQTALDMATEGVVVRGTTVTKELYHLINFLLRSFMRPTESEVYALRHRDIAVAQNPQRLLISVQGKTGLRTVNSMPLCVDTYRALEALHTHGRDSFVFLPQYTNRKTALQIFQRQFNALLSRCNLKLDAKSGLTHSVYSLRHTAICTRLVRSGGKVNIYSLAKNAGTSVSQIERFYARYLGLDVNMVKNLQHVADDFIGMSEEWI